MPLIVPAPESDVWPLKVSEPVPNPANMLFGLFEVLIPPSPLSVTAPGDDNFGIVLGGIDEELTSLR